MIKLVFPAIVIFQIITLCLYYFGPINYLFRGSPDSVVLLVLSYLTLLVLGYLGGAKLYLRGSTGPRNASRFLKRASIVVLFFSIIDLIYVSRSFNLGSTLGQAYGLAQENKSENVSVFAYLRMFFGYFIFGLLPIFFLWRKRLTKSLYVICMVAIVVNLLSGVMSGVNKKLFDYLIIGLVLGLMGLTSIGDVKKIAKLSIAMVVSIFLAGSFFLEGQLTRYGSFAISGVSDKLGAYSDYKAADGELLVFYSAMSGYLSQGYRAIELSLDIPFEFTWGVGNSSFFSRQIDKLFETDIENATYPARIETYGWDRYNQWSTFYTWWASDLTFYGVAILMFFIGFLFRCIENTLLVQRDIASIIGYFYMVILCFYLSANNQIFQSGESSLGFLFIAIPMLYKRKLVNPYKISGFRPV